MIFVFGSNRAGRHGKGAALHALKNQGAVPGQGEGLQGSSYAIPTKGTEKRGTLSTLSLQEIHGHVDTFLDVATHMPWLDFSVTRIGCGLAGYTDEEIAPMFAAAPANCRLPLEWLKIVGRGVRLLVCGGRDYRDEQRVFAVLDEVCARVGVEMLIEGGQRKEERGELVGGADYWASRWADARGVAHEAMRADWKAHGRAAGPLRNSAMLESWEPHMLVAFPGGAGTADMTRKAMNAEVVIYPVPDAIDMTDRAAP